MKNTTRKTGKNAIKTFIESLAKPDTARLLEILMIEDRQSHERAIQLAGDLMTEIDDNPAHPACGFLDLLADAIERYENRIYGLPRKVSPAETLAFLMEQHGLTQNDLAEEIGDQGNVSRILSGKRELNLRQIRKLADRFNVAPSFFL